ncbi:TonB-dependent siderophore receptor [Kingella negevensis]|uniref:Ferrichrome receptor FcuA n=1 Tax=Kingella negevensis TaxID=1522312 RepID=A0A238HER2_9NEIS|nr:TonB-dependent receptor [Kingella negevensis]MDK4680190.1 TonB-dependent siderophore receptor [Kingella negevensis]MDK4682090.1 TonB-dependent siderophore receptor [Kingella negevensis]MDK4690286.1 TonB-dependent siderophore receptor [Kingella negevensis]MDK4692368.1 TonB-dependent siderophore receptor [Kingella negevensis]MDK4696507.1 TonB-dependent siderophore receptor [Kingella negevensis]
MKLKHLSLLICTLGASIATAAPVEKQDLQTLTVTSKRVRALSKNTGGDLRDTANLGLLGKTNSFQAPITVVNYDAKVINNTEARTLVDVIAKKDVSTWQFGGETNTLTGLYFRGFQLDARQFSVNGLAGMYGTQGTASVHVGSAQLIKGASTAITGMDPEGAVSGAMNIETKKASNKGNRDISAAWFSDSRAQIAADVGQRFGESKEWGLRVNGKMRQGDTPREGYDEDNKEFAINGDYYGERLRLSLDSIYAKRKTNGGRGRIQDIQNAQGRLFDALDGKNNLAPSWQAQTTRSTTNMATFEYDVAENTMITGGVGYNDARYYGNFASPTAETSGLTYKSGEARLTDQRFKTLSMNLAARGDFNTGSISHSWNAAFDRINRKRLTYTGVNKTKSVSINPALDLPAQLNRLGNNLGTAWQDNPTTDTKIGVNSLALSDTLGFKNNEYRLTLGGRYQMVKQDDHKEQLSADASRFSPMVMAAWVPNSNLTVYGNYMEDLEPVSPRSDEDGNSTMADPRVSRQFEIGVRKNWGNFVTTLNAFQITRPGYWYGKANSKDKTKTDDFKAFGNAVYAGKAQGKERNRGLEFNIYSSLFNNTVRPSFGLMYLQSHLKDYPNYKDNLINGVQVANPRIVAKTNVEWDTPFVKGLTLNAGVQHYGKSYQDTQKTYAFPSYTLVDIGAKYSMNLRNKQRVSVSGAVENLFNKNYWQVQRGQYDRSFAVLGMPRTFWVKADWSF